MQVTFGLQRIELITVEFIKIDLATPVPSDRNGIRKRERQCKRVSADPSSIGTWSELE